MPRREQQVTEPPGDRARTLVDPVTGRPILMAPARRHRPLHTADGADADADCPFCPGHEAMTPPEVDAVRAPGTAADGPGWTARAFPNLYPAAARHEVIAEGAAHASQPAAVPATEWQAILRLWRRRIAAMERDADVAVAFLFKNVGLRAGASIAHNHSQLLGLPDLPPRLQLMIAHMHGMTPNPLAADLAAAAEDRRLVADHGAYLVLCPAHPKLPFETWVLPRRLDEDFLDPADPAALAAALHAAFVAFDRAFAAPPFNLYLLRDPRGAFPWHLELQPRTGNLAGLELGGDMYINSVPGAESAARLRQALAAP